MITCSHGPKALCDACRIDLQRNEIETLRGNLKRAKAHTETTEALLAQHRAWHSENVNQIAADGERIKALEARLAEVGPVVEAAEAWQDAKHWREEREWRYQLDAAIDKMRAARSLRGAGENNQEGTAHV